MQTDRLNFSGNFLIETLGLDLKFDVYYEARKYINLIFHFIGHDTLRELTVRLLCDCSVA